MARGKQYQILGPVDTAFYYVDRPEAPMNIGAVTIFDGLIDFEAFVRLVDSRLHQAPLYRQRVVQAPLSLGQPTWMSDPDFFVRNHVFRHRLDAPGTEEQLRQLSGHLVCGMLDRSKPLWEIHLIEGLEGGRTAIVFKIHHCMVDGVSAIELFTLLLDLSPDMPPSAPKPFYDPPPLPNGPQLVLQAIREDIPHRLNLLRKLGGDLGHLGSVFSDREKRRKALFGIANLINDNLRPIGQLAINGKNTGKMTLAWAEFSLAEVRAIKSVCGASVNDVMLTVLGSAIEIYLRAHDELRKNRFVRMLVPVNMRPEGEKAGIGNRISVLPIDIPFGVSDPVERLSTVADYTRVMKQSSLSNTLDMVLTLPSLAPSPLQPLVWGAAPLAFSLLAHMWCTNVPGPQIPMYLLGRRLQHTYGYFPLNPSMGLACVVTSYNQRISMTLIADYGIVPDVLDLRNYLNNAYIALRKAAKVPEMDPIQVDRVRVAPSRRAETPPPEPELPALPDPARHLDPLADAASTQRGEANELPIVSGLPELPESTARPVQPAPNGTQPDTITPDPPPGPAAEAPASPPADAVPPADTATSGGDSQPDHHSESGEAQHNASDGGHPPRLKLFSEEWAQAYRAAINANPAYRNVSKGWVAGALAFVMDAAPQQGFPRACAVIMELHRGECRAARSLTPEDAKQQAAFVIEGDYHSWLEVLKGRAQPLNLIMRGRLRLTKGTAIRLLPFAQSAQELIASAQRVAWQP
jgi:diacylglycerol O-acyltransferase